MFMARTATIIAIEAFNSILESFKCFCRLVLSFSSHALHLYRNELSNADKETIPKMRHNMEASMAFSPYALLQALLFEILQQRLFGNLLVAKWMECILPRRLRKDQIDKIKQGMIHEVVYNFIHHHHVGLRQGNAVQMPAIHNVQRAILLILFIDFRNDWTIASGLYLLVKAWLLSIRLDEKIGLRHV